MWTVQPPAVTGQASPSFEGTLLKIISMIGFIVYPNILLLFQQITVIVIIAMKSNYHLVLCLHHMMARSYLHDISWQ